MSDFFMSGPAVGIGDGTLLVGWPCRYAPPTNDSAEPFNMIPMAASWVEGTLYVVVMQPDGMVTTADVDNLQFNPRWSRK